MSEGKQLPQNMIDPDIKRTYISYRIIEKLNETKAAYALGHDFVAKVKLESAFKLLSVVLEGKIFAENDINSLMNEIKLLEKMVERKSNELEVVTDIEKMVNKIMALSTKCPKCGEFSLKPSITETLWICKNCGYSAFISLNLH